MKNLLFILTFSFLTLFLGCKSAKVTQIPVKTVERVTERLVPIEMPEDSALLVALFECDSLNRVLVKDFKEVKGKQTATAFNFKDGRLNYKANFKPDTVYLPSTTIETEKEVPVVVEVPVVEYQQTKFQKVFFYIGLLACAIGAGWLAAKLNLFKILK